MLGSFNLGWAHLEVVTSMMIALPLGPLLVHRMWRRRTLGSVVATAAGFALLTISGHLLWQVLIWMIPALYAAALGITSALQAWRSGDRSTAWGHLWRPPLAFGLGGALAAVVLVPTWINLSQTPREAFAVDLLGVFETPAATFTTDFLRGPSFETMTTEVMNYRLAFVGTLVAVLAVIGFFSRRQGSGLARTIMLVTAGVATVGPLRRLAYEVVPGMNVFYPYGRLAGTLGVGGAGSLAIGFVANRYLIDFLLPLVLLAAVAMASNVWPAWLTRRRAVAGLSLLTAWGLLVNIGLGLWAGLAREPSFTSARYRVDAAAFPAPSPALVEINDQTDLDDRPRLGIVGIDTTGGTCEGVYMSTFDEWTVLDLGASRSLTGDLDVPGRGDDPVLLAGRDNWRIDVDPTGRVTLTDDGLESTLVKLDLPVGDPLPVEVTLDPVSGFAGLRVGEEFTFLPPSLIGSASPLDGELDVQPSNELCTLLQERIGSPQG